MHPNEALIDSFYKAFQKKDHAAMAACYHPDVEFSDAVFQGLKGERAKAMWHMLCERGKDLSITYGGIKADDEKGEAWWDARYTFSGTGRPVLNQIKARFRFKDGKIIQHEDTFDLWKWTGMALGLKGKLLGWTPLVQNTVRKMAQKGLDKFMESSGTR
ncbi:MAG: nuclear transport factor 2 family protein [Myxococcota bacterium]